MSTSLLQPRRSYHMYIMCTIQSLGTVVKETCLAEVLMREAKALRFAGQIVCLIRVVEYHKDEDYQQKLTNTKTDPDPTQSLPSP